MCHNADYKSGVVYFWFGAVPRAVDTGPLKDSKLLATRYRSLLSEGRLKELPSSDIAIQYGYTESTYEYRALLHDLCLILTEEAVNEVQGTAQAILLRLIRILREIDHSISRLSEQIEDYYKISCKDRVSVQGLSTSQIIHKLALDSYDPVSGLCTEIKRLKGERSGVAKAVQRMAEETMPNVSAICGPMVAARLLEKAGSVEKLAHSPASAIQVLGASSALFAHKVRGAPGPKHGIIYEHKRVHAAKRKVRGRVSRVLADQIAIAVRIDFFTGVEDARFLAKAEGKIRKAGMMHDLD